MSNQEKRRVFEEHLKEQQRQREVNLQKKKQAESLKNSQEDMLFIQKQFRTLNQEMERLTIAVKKGEGATLAELFAHYNQMKNYYLQINYVLTTYDRQYYKELLQRIHGGLLELKKKHQPKKKFKFSRRDQDFGVKEKEQAQEFKAVQSQQSQIAGIENRKGETIVLEQECPEGGSYRIIDCDNSEVTLLQKTEILFLKNLKNCKIRCAVTKSTVFVDNCVGCTLQLNCHQLRIHNSFDSTFRVFVTSKAIIEDCDRVIFGVYSFQYPARQTHEEQEQRVGKPNLWREVQDFNWLKENQKSPHYHLQEQAVIHLNIHYEGSSFQRDHSLWKAFKQQMTNLFVNHHYHG